MQFEVFTLVAFTEHWIDSRKIDKWLFCQRYVKRFGCTYIHKI